MYCVDIPDVTEMESLGGKVAAHCPAGTRIFLQGELGAGKTTIVRGFLRAFGYPDIVKSPTYTLVEPYYLPNGTIYHFDFYRLNQPEEVEAIGLRDYFDSDAICLVEWPENAKSKLGNPDLYIRIEHMTVGRKVEINASSPAGTSILKSLN